VRDVRDVSSLFARPEHGERQPVGERRRDLPERHIWPLARSIDGEVTQSDLLEPQRLGISVGEMLAADLRDTVRRDRPRARVFACRTLLRVAVYRRGRRPYNPDARLERRLEHALGRDDVIAGIRRERLPPAATDAWLSGEVEDSIDAPEERIERVHCE